MVALNFVICFIRGFIMGTTCAILLLLVFSLAGCATKKPPYWLDELEAKGVNKGDAVCVKDEPESDFECDCFGNYLYKTHSGMYEIEGMCHRVGYDQVMRMVVPAEYVVKRVKE